MLYNSLPEGMCDNEYESLEQAVNDVETFQYSHETSTKHVLVQGVYVGSASPLIANIKTQPYPMLMKCGYLKPSAIKKSKSLVLIVYSFIICSK